MTINSLDYAVKVCKMKAHKRSLDHCYVHIYKKDNDNNPFAYTLIKNINSEQRIYINIDNSICNEFVHIWYIQEGSNYSTKSEQYRLDYTDELDVLLLISRDNRIVKSHKDFIYFFNEVFNNYLFSNV